MRQDLIAALILSVIIGPTVWVFNIFGMGFAVGSLLLLVEHIGIVLMICMVPVAIRAYLRMSLDDLQAQEAAIAPAELAPMSEAQTLFLRRLDPEKRGAVQRVSADGHQLLVYTDQGGSKVRLRFGDALEELTAFNGTRIHRSHWVAYDAIEAVVPDGRRHAVHLPCGTRLPVSQNGLSALRDAGINVG